MSHEELDIQMGLYFMRDSKGKFIKGHPNIKEDFITLLKDIWGFQNGHKHSEKSKLKMSLSKKGKPCYRFKEMVE